MEHCLNKVSQVTISVISLKKAVQMKNRQNNFLENLDITQLHLPCGCRQIPQKMIVTKFQPKGWFVYFDTAHYECMVCEKVKKVYVKVPWFGQPELIVKMVREGKEV